MFFQGYFFSKGKGREIIMIWQQNHRFQNRIIYLSRPKLQLIIYYIECHHSLLLPAYWQDGGQHCCRMIFKTILHKMCLPLPCWIHFEKNIICISVNAEHLDCTENHYLFPGVSHCSPMSSYLIFTSDRRLWQWLMFCLKCGLEEKPGIVTILGRTGNLVVRNRINVDKTNYFKVQAIFSYLKCIMYQK